MASYCAPKKALCQRRPQRYILYIAGNDELYGELLQGGLEAWTVERGMCNDGFTFDFGASLDHSNFLEDNNVVCWTKRRTSPMNNDAAVNPSNGYPRMVLVRAVTLSTKESRSAFADRMVAVRRTLRGPKHTSYPADTFPHYHRNSIPQKKTGGGRVNLS